MDGKVMFLHVAVALSLMAVCTADNVEFKDCGSKEGEVSKLDVTPCPTEPCVFKKGTTVKAVVTFTPAETVTNSTIKIYGVIGGFPAPFPFDNPDGCKDHGLSCPLKSGVEANLELALDVLKSYPSLSNVVVKLEFLDQDDKMIFCVEFPASIQG